MVFKQAAPRVLFPRTINQALEYYGSESDAVFWAGGTGFARRGSRVGRRVELPKVVIALSLVEEMARASRTDSSLEIGATMSLDRLAAIGRNALPPGLNDVLSGIGTRPLRCRATIGGNLASGNRHDGLAKGDLLPLLQLLDAKVEIRYLRERKGRRKPVATVKRIPLMVLEEEHGLRRGDLMTRISIPTGTWNFAVVEKLVPVDRDSTPLIFQAVAQVEKNTLVDWRMIFWDGEGPYLRHRDIEASLAGSPLPLTRRSTEMLDEAVLQTVGDIGKTDRQTAVCLARTFLKRAAG